MKKKNDIIEIRSSIETILEKYKCESVYFPLAIGNHPDHLLTYKIGITLNLYRNCFFYADLPYALTRSFVKNRFKKFISKKKININCIYKNSRDSPSDSNNLHIINLFKDCCNYISFCYKRKYKLELIEIFGQKYNKLELINCYKTQLSLFKMNDLKNFEIEYYFKIFD